jgi:hypothetical protein
VAIVCSILLQKEVAQTMVFFSAAQFIIIYCSFLLVTVPYVNAKNSTVAGVTGIATSSVYLDAPFNFTLVYDPPYNATTVTAMGIFVRAHVDGVESTEAVVCYCTDEERVVNVHGGFDYPIEVDPLGVRQATYNSPYIQLATPFKATRIRYIAMIAILAVQELDSSGDTITIMYRSTPVLLRYNVEGGARPLAYGTLLFFH